MPRSFKFNICPLAMVMVIPFTFILYCYPSISEATTVVAIKTENGIFIGADSKSTKSPDKHCKIIQGGNTFFAIAGSPFFNAVYTSNWFGELGEIEVFNVYMAIAKATIIKKTISEQVAVFESTVVGELSWILESTRVGSQGSFCREYSRWDNILSGVIAGVEKSTPVLYGREFRLITACTEPVVIDVVSKNNTEKFPSGSATALLYGVHDTILKNRPNTPIVVEKIPEYINEWITWETVSNPDKVGLPIDILHITQKGAKWIQHKNPECKEIY